MTDARRSELPVLVLPALGVGARAAAWREADGAITAIDLDTARLRARGTPALVCHATALAARLKIERCAAYDLLELFAFARPAQFVLPTPAGLADALDLARPANLADECDLLVRAAMLLLGELGQLAQPQKQRAAQTAQVMRRAGWLWGAVVLEALASAPAPLGGGIDVWTRLSEWAEYSGPPAPEQIGVSEAEARERLAELLGPTAEARPAQADYAALAAHAFAPRQAIDAPNVVLAEAGTGIGKTLGYIAPASLWAEKNGGAVWISTFTKNLQRQIDQELDRLYPDPRVKAAKAVVRKGRENYLCLLNMQEAWAGGAARPADTVALGFIARWAEATRDGDMVGGDFPAWLAELHGPGRTLGLTDRRGECIYSACPHYRRCYIERNIRKARRADLVIANHALVMLQSVMANDPRELPTRYVLDEGHHVFDTADSAFSAELSGVEGAELRRWLRGPEASRRSRARGLVGRIGDLVAGIESAKAALDAVLHAARILPADNWLSRLAEHRPAGPFEAFLGLVRDQVLARARETDGRYGIECPTTEPLAGLIDAAKALDAGLGAIMDPVRRLRAALAKMLDAEAAELDTATRGRIDAAVRGLERRGLVLAAWRAMLGDLSTGTPADYVDWFALAREAGRDADVAFHRRWLDPMRPFAEAVLKPAHGVLITSASLKDRRGGDDDDWQAAELRTGARHLTLPAKRASLASPFDHGARTRVLAITDVRRDSPAQVAAAYRELFLAAGGGGLGLFTAIWRLRAVHERIAAALEDAGIKLYAQHVDPIDTATLVDIFRADVDACLLGTDAVRDGVDVPGSSLRLIVFDRVPWPRPDILHRARRNAFGKQAYDDMLTRLKLKQAYGRLLRRADDRGVFVMLDAMLPSRLLDAFPTEVEVRRVGLAEAVADIRAFVAPPAGQAARQRQSEH